MNVRAHRGTPALVALAAMLAIVLVARQAAAQSCDNLPPSTLRVYGTEHAGLSVAPATMAEIDRLAAEHSVPESLRHAPLVLMVPELTSSFAMDERATEVGPGVFCAAPASVEARIGITQYRVFIERSAWADDCVRERLIAHARRHLDVDNREIVAALARTRAPLGERLTPLKRTPAASAGEAIARLKAAVAEVLLEAVESFGHARVAGHAAIDTPDEMANLGESCNGRMRLLESEARTPGRDT